MDNPLLDMEHAQSRLSAWRTNADRLARETQAAGQALQGLRATGADGNQIAEVTVDSGGAMVAIKLSSRIQRQAPEHTQAVILEAYRAAKANLAEAAAGIVADTVGADTATGRALLAGFAPGEPPEER